MGIALDAETERLAPRLAEPAQTIKEALTPAQQAKVERTMAVVAALPHLPAGTGDPTAVLYDEHGLPC